MSHDPELIADLERAKQINRESRDSITYYRHPLLFGMLTALALFEIVALLWPGHLTDHFHTLRAGLRIGFIWAIALADWITKRRWLKRHSEVRDFPMANTVFVLALLALYCWDSGY
ncbi:MAG: hypothetical protein DMG26_04070 [Acidobacteria bacterium]|nr:MAG: hypothetical protein DMG25_13200 [Acidobacteriota bacterium]PYV06003.1 MAG: hypothetical protein DMG26_04070 [Acidobacteriota bacterium]PYV24418.1 MAG: hypothetical protein DMG27_12940 [Acidobacteriota bacterium]